MKPKMPRLMTSSGVLLNPRVGSLASPATPSPYTLSPASTLPYPVSPLDRLRSQEASARVPQDYDSDYREPGRGLALLRSPWSASSSTRSFTTTTSSSASVSLMLHTIEVPRARYQRACDHAL